MQFNFTPQRILDFDIENRPLTYIGPDFTTCDVTAIAASFGRQDRMYTWLVGEVPPRTMLLDFSELYNQADIVTGHYIRKHDLPIINGALLEAGLPGLGPKLTSDTKLDLVNVTGISKSQESLADMLGVKTDKEHMTQGDWRSANRLEVDGIERARTRVVKDVRQHQEMRAELIRRHLLGSPKMWSGTKG